MYAVVNSSETEVYAGVTNAGKIKPVWEAWPITDESKIVVFASRATAIEVVDELLALNCAGAKVVRI
jgi:hypothetical protein